MQPAVMIAPGPPPNLAMQALILEGTVPFGQSFALVVDGVPIDPVPDSAGLITPTYKLWIASEMPITVYLGDGTTNQVVASWWDRWARPRCISGYEGAQLSVRVASTGLVVVWGATAFTALPQP